MLSINEFVLVGKAVFFYSSGQAERIESFKASFDDGQHQLILRLKETEEFPATEAVILESGKDYTEAVKTLNELLGASK